MEEKVINEVIEETAEVATDLANELSTQVANVPKSNVMVKGTLLGMAIATGAYGAYKYVIKPVSKKIKQMIEEKKGEKDVYVEPADTSEYEVIEVSAEEIKEEPKKNKKK